MKPCEELLTSSGSLWNLRFVYIKFGIGVCHVYYLLGFWFIQLSWISTQLLNCLSDYCPSQFIFNWLSIFLVLETHMVCSFLFQPPVLTPDSMVVESVLLVLWLNKSLHTMWVSRTKIEELWQQAGGASSLSFSDLWYHVWGGVLKVAVIIVIWMDVITLWGGSWGTSVRKLHRSEQLPESRC